MEGLSYSVKQSSGAKARRENEEAFCFTLPWRERVGEYRESDMRRGGVSGVEVVCSV